MALSHIKNIFVPFQPAPEGVASGALGYAMSMAEKARAHLTVRAFAVKVGSPYTVAPAFVNSLVGPVNAKHQAELDKAYAALKQRIEGAPFACDSSAKLLDHDDILGVVGFQGRLHDINIVDMPYEYFTVGRAMVEEILFHTGRPIVVVPKTVSAFSANRIVVAWDGSARAARALNDAMPFLRGAEHVELVSVVNEKDLSKMVAGAEIAPHLARHGVKAEVVDLELDGKAGATILRRATLVSADMIVMGAFAHSRWRQFILGGVTESMLLDAEIPVFMSH
jgi:nucleotide-binding universal stress UspA family protein